MNSNLGFLAGVVADYGMPTEIHVNAPWAAHIEAAYPAIPVLPAASGEEHLIRVYLGDGTTHAATISAE